MPLDLNSIQFLDPALQQQAMSMVGTQQQAGVLANQQTQQDIQAKTLANLYSQQADPLRLQQLGLTNQHQGLLNQSQQMGNDVRAAALPQEKEAQKAKWLAQASDDDLKTLYAKGEAKSAYGASIGNQDMIDEGQRMRDASWKAQAARQQQGAEQTKAETAANSRVTVANVQGEAKRDVATTGANARMYSADVMAQARQMLHEQTPAQAYAKAYQDYAAHPQDEGKRQLAEALHDTLMQIPVAGQADKLNVPGMTNLPAVGTPKMPTITTPSGVSVPLAPTQPQQPAAPGGPSMAPLQSNVSSRVAPQAQAARDSDRVGILYNELASGKNIYSQGDYDAASRELRRAGYTGALPPYKQATSTAAAPATNAPQAPAGRVVIYKDGKPAGTIPQSQADAAKAQGYTLQ